MRTTSELLVVEAEPGRRRMTTVDVIIPVYNEEADLSASVHRLHDYLTDRFPLGWLITIADNASTDGTWGIACRLTQDLEGVQAIHVNQKGRGRALRAAWLASPAPVAAYMDVDLSTDLDGLLPLVAPLVSGHSDVAIGTRLAPGSRVARGPRREVVSRGYNLILKATLRHDFSDAQCGFKAIRTDVARGLLPLVEDEGWFFDTELLVLAEHNGLRIHEVPVDWVDDPDSRVDMVSTVKGDLLGIWRMLRRFAREDLSFAVEPGTRGRTRPVPADLGAQLVRFASIGVVSTVVFGLLFLLLVGPMGALAASIVALGACSVANTAANRRLTFSLRDPAVRRRRGALAALAALPVLVTAATLLTLAALGVTEVLGQVAALVLANAAATLVRFVLLRRLYVGAARSGSRPLGASGLAPMGRPPTEIDVRS
jgi:glycosyltransferase involved in cell wall biosynthesis/putative flippase GtrA